MAVFNPPVGPKSSKTPVTATSGNFVAFGSTSDILTDSGKVIPSYDAPLYYLRLNAAGTALEFATVPSDWASWLSGSGAPTSGTGDMNDFYLDISTSTYYGPKTSEGWPTGVSIIGATGTSGNSWLSGSGAPDAGTGVDGDFYLDTANSVYYGPKSTTWPAGISIMGATGPAEIHSITATDVAASDDEFVIYDASEFATRKITMGDTFSNMLCSAVNYVIDGGGSAFATGSHGYIQVPFNGSISGWYIYGDQTGSTVVDVKKATIGEFPTFASIAGTEKPTLTSARSNNNIGLSTWTTTLVSDDILEFYVDSVSTITRVTVVLYLWRDIAWY